MIIILTPEQTIPATTIDIGTPDPSVFKYFDDNAAQVVTAFLPGTDLKFVVWQGGSYPTGNWTQSDLETAISAWLTANQAS
jgi:hypothetical protein